MTRASLDADERVAAADHDDARDRRARRLRRAGLHRHDIA
jgi:hypothetical protein